MADLTGVSTAQPTKTIGAYCLVTHGGPHPSEKWAELTVKQIMAVVKIEDTAPPKAQQDKADIEGRLLGLLLRHYDDVQNQERSALKARGFDQLSRSFDPPGLGQCLGAVTAATRGTTLAEGFASEKMQAHVHALLRQHSNDIIHIERLWHCDTDPDHPAVHQYRSNISALAA